MASSGEVEPFDLGHGVNADGSGGERCLVLGKASVSWVAPEAPESGEAQGCEGFPCLTDARGEMMLKQTYCCLEVERPRGFCPHERGRDGMRVAHGKCWQGKHGTVRSYHVRGRARMCGRESCEVSSLDDGQGLSTPDTMIGPTECNRNHQ